MIDQKCCDKGQTYSYSSRKNNICIDLYILENIDPEIKIENMGENDEILKTI